MGHEHVGRRAEAVHRQPPARRQAAPQQGPVADDPRTQERRRLHVAEGRREFVGEVFRHYGVLGVAAVGMVAGEAGLLAQVLPPRRAEPAPPARPPQPGHADPLAGTEAVAAGPQNVDRAHDLVARYDGHFLPRRSPSTTCRSVRQTPQQQTFSRTSPAAGSGSATSTNRSGADSIGRGSSSSMAFMALDYTCVRQGPRAAGGGWRERPALFRPRRSRTIFPSPGIFAPTIRALTRPAHVFPQPRRLRLWLGRS